MTKPMRIQKALGFFTLIVTATAIESPVGAQSFDQSGLLTAMQQRTEYGAPLRTLKSQGYLSARPRIRTNYDDYYIPTRAFSVMGSRVIVVQENYLSRYVGCCADPGIGLYFETSSVPSLNTIRDFAVANKCIYRQGFGLIRDELPPSFIRFRAGKYYAFLRCSDGDEARIQQP